MKMGRTIFLFAMLGCLAMVSAHSTTHHVGNSYGWRLPDDKLLYENWSKGKKFTLGDKLVFRYKPESENVVEVEKDDFDLCTIRHVVHTFFQNEVTVNLNRTGDFYFICTVGKHCEAGQKLRVSVNE